jgi:hypothetical protein
MASNFESYVKSHLRSSLELLQSQLLNAAGKTNHPEHRYKFAVLKAQASSVRAVSTHCLGKLIGAGVSSNTLILR